MRSFITSRMGLWSKITVLLLLFSTLAKSQISITGSIADAETGSPLAFCSVAIKGSSKGCLANAEGNFTISVDVRKDVLIFYYLGYERLEIAAVSLLTNSHVLLRRTEKVLEEVTIFSGDERLYDLLIKCRNNIRRSKKFHSKAYFQLSSEANGEWLEMTECYYNATVRGSSIKQLALKNGRAGLAEFDHRYFISFNTSRAIRYLDLVRKSDYLPDLPLQLNVRAMKKQYSLRQLSEDAFTYHISFTPKKEPRNYFSGELWIDKKTFALHKIALVCEHAAVHPFLPFAEDTLKNVSLYITHTYENESGHAWLNHINFSYTLQHKSLRRPDSPGRRYTDLPGREITTTGLVYFYDHGDQFILPYYRYNPDYPDFRKISLIPYNPSFWANTNGLLHTEEQKKTIDFFDKNGVLVNFTKHRLWENGRRGFYETNNYVWTDSTRVNYERNTYSPGQNQGNPFSPLSYHLSVQIYLDVNKTIDGLLEHFSATEFDAMNTYMPEPIEAPGKCFMNIYFDLYEIERRKMEKSLSTGTASLYEIDSVYQEANKHLKQITREYTSEVNAGANIEAMKRWNTYCYEQLGMDNMKIFGVEQWIASRKKK